MYGHFIKESFQEQLFELTVSGNLVYKPVGLCVKLLNDGPNPTSPELGEYRYTCNELGKNTCTTIYLIQGNSMNC